LNFIYRTKAPCQPTSLEADLGGFKLYATPYSETGAAAPGRISELRLPASVAKGGNNAVTFVDGARLISFDRARKSLLLSAAGGRLIKLLTEGGFHESAVAAVYPGTEHAVLWWDSDETNLAKLAFDMDRTIREAEGASARQKRELLGLSKGDNRLIWLDEDSETRLYVEENGTVRRSQYNRAYLRGNYISEAVRNDPLNDIIQVKWLPASNAAEEPRCEASDRPELTRRTLNLGTMRRPLMVDLVGPAGPATNIVIHFGGGPSGWNRRPEDIQFIRSLLATGSIAVAEVAYSGSSGSGLATFNRLRTEGVNRAINGDTASIVRWLRGKQTPVLIVGASFGSAFASSLGAAIGDQTRRCVRLALMVPLVAHTVETYANMGNNIAYQLAFERSLLGRDVAQSWARYNNVSKESLDAPGRPPTTFLVAKNDKLIRTESILQFARQVRDEVIILKGSHSTSGGDPAVVIALQKALASCAS
jgi:hypothetical protein